MDPEGISIAVQIHRQALELGKEYLGLEHLNTLTSMKELASVLSGQGKYAKAAQIMGQALELMKKRSDPENAEELTRMSEIASLLSRQGYEEAEQMDEQALELRRKVFLLTPLMEPHQYSEALLDRQIRLLHLDLDSTLSIRCRLVLSSLQYVEYTALSYTWGDTTDRVPIGCDDKEVLVTWNLYTALKHLRAQELSGPFWIDAICLNQGNFQEKLAQIQMMKEIYTHASRVVIWLGEESGESQLAMGKIADISFASTSGKEAMAAAIVTDQFRIQLSPVSAGHTFDESVTKHLRQVYKDHMLRNVPDFGESSVGPCAPLLEAWLAVQNLLDRPWFCRAWIRQEASALEPDNVYFLCGEDSITIETLEEWWWATSFSIENAQGAEMGMLDFVPRLGHEIVCIKKLREQQLSSEKMPLQNLLQDLRGAKATNARDKVYCLVSFATDINDPGLEFEADYTLKMEEVYTGFAVWSIRRYRNLDVLGACRGNPARNKVELPSWVPDWCAMANGQAFIKVVDYQDLSSIPLYYTSGSFVNNIRISSPTPPNARLLGLEGICIATVDRILPAVTNVTIVSVEASWTMETRDGWCSLNNTDMTTIQAYTIATDRKLPVGKQLTRHEVRGGFSSVSELLSTGRIMDSKMWTLDRRLFFTQLDSEGGKGLLGFSDATILAGDSVWMFKGGKVLYILREKEADGDRTLSVFNVTGEKHHSLNINKGDKQFVLAGECFVHGLMDGQLLDFMGEVPRKARPASLEQMDRDFRKIYLA